MPMRPSIKGTWIWRQTNAELTSRANSAALRDWVRNRVLPQTLKHLPQKEKAPLSATNNVPDRSAGELA
jgi:hypothetical protein